MKLSVVIPAYNEEKNLPETLDTLLPVLRAEGIEFEVVVVNDNSRDSTRSVVLARMNDDPEVVLVDNVPPGGFGRAIRAGLAHFTGDAVAIMMADQSDDPVDLVRCFRALERGYDCVFGSRFRRESRVSAYPAVKLVVNRVVNKGLQVLFLTPFNDLTNAFKVYRRSAIEGLGPLHACHFNITIELSLGCVIRGYRIAELPINWSGRTWGVSNLRLRQMGRRYLATLLKIWLERLLVADDIHADLAHGKSRVGTPERHDSRTTHLSREGSVSHDV